MDRVLSDIVLALDSHDGGQGSVGDDGDTLALGVDLGKVGERLGDLLEVSSSKVVGSSVRLGLTLVANNVIPVRGRGVKGVLEELGNEGGGQRQDKGLVAAGSLLAQLHNGGRANGEVVATDIIGLGVLDELPHLGALEMLDVVVVGSTELSYHAAVVASDDDTTPTGGDLGVDTVLDAETSLLDGVLEDGGILVVTDTTEVDDAVGGQDVLRATSRVLGRTTSDQLGIVVVEELLVDWQVLLLGEDGVVLLELILVE